MFKSKKGDIKDIKLAVSTVIFSIQPISILSI